jgi:nucleoside triphosphate diphosphatase
MTSKIEQLKEIMKLLRDPETGCPWDVEQNFKSIASCTLEEAYEVFDAIEENDMDSLKEELGDLLLQVIFHAQMASEENIFDFEDVAGAIINKLIVRHPHVFGDAEIKTASEQESAWERQKEIERKDKAADGGAHSLLDGVAKALPATIRAAKLQKRAAKVGFDWPDLIGVFAKIEEELCEVRHAVEIQDGIKEEIGDLLFSVVNLARKLDIDPEDALRRCNGKFERRFNHIEKKISDAGEQISSSSLEKMEGLWNEAKELERL